MNKGSLFLPKRLWLGLAASLLLCIPRPAQANVFASNIRLNGSTNAVSIGFGGNVTIGYLLNDSATAGVSVQILSNGVAVRSINAAGTAQGANSVIWDGTADNGSNVVSGTYSVQVTAAAIGYGNWFQMTVNGLQTQVSAATGIAVNQNTNSPYYGRVFVANGISLFGGTEASDLVGIQKFEPDGTWALEDNSTNFSTGGWPWAGDGFSPWKIAVSADDYVYVGDFNLSGGGTVVRFDQTISTNSQLAVLRADNWPNGSVRLSGPFVTGQGATTQIWMADTNVSGAGIRRWNVTGNGAVATNDTGALIVQSGGGSQLDQAPFAVAVDASNRIYTIQYVLDSGDPSFRLFRFPAYTNLFETNTVWETGSGDNPVTMLGAYGVAVDPTATYVAVAFRVGAQDDPTGGNVEIFSAADGSYIMTLDSGIDHSDVAWDHVGNLYVCDLRNFVWRAISPPGANQATTIALATVQVGLPPTRPIFSNPSYSAGQFSCTLNGQANVTYVIQALTNLPSTNWLAVLTNTSPAAVREISVPAPNATSFYRAVVAQ